VAVYRHQRVQTIREMRGKIWSPGRPSTARREHRVRFWEAIARGLSSEDAAAEAGMSPAVGTRWYRESGGMPPLELVPTSGRYLSFAEREEIAILHAQDCGVREIARRLGRSPSTISRLRRQFRQLSVSRSNDERLQRPRARSLQRAARRSDRRRRSRNVRSGHLAIAGRATDVVGVRLRSRSPRTRRIRPRTSQLISPPISAPMPLTGVPSRTVHIAFCATAP